MLHECKEVSIIKLRHLVHSTTKGLLFEQQTMTIITMTGHIGPAATGHSIQLDQEPGLCQTQALLLT